MNKEITIKPYYRKGNKYFYRKGRQRMTITHTGTGNYVFDGDVIEGKIQLPPITTDGSMTNTPVEIRTY